LRNRCRGFSWLVLALGSFVLVAVILFVVFPPKDDSKEPALPAPDYQKRFEWADAIPYLRRAAALPPEEAVRLLLQNSVHLRTYVAIELTACASGPFCNQRVGDPALETEITRRIDDAIKAKLRTGGSVTSADIAFPRQPYPFTFLAALKPHTSRSATLIASLTRGNGLTLTRVINNYGEPAEERTTARGRILVYKAEGADYTSKTEFTVSGNTGETTDVMISVQRRR
jgi:hypothetical protein